jgi:hypothetical protein
MNIATAKLVILAVLGLATASVTMLLSQTSSEVDVRSQSVESDTEREPAVDGLALRIVAKYRVVRDVIAGRFSLLEGAALFGALNRMPPQSASLSLLDRQSPRLGFHPHTNEERLCRQVMEFVVHELAEEPDRQKTALARLQAEFRAELRMQRNIQLPDPSRLFSVEELLEEARADLAEQRHSAIQGAEIVRPESPGELPSSPG